MISTASRSDAICRLFFRYGLQPNEPLLSKLRRPDVEPRLDSLPTCLQRLLPLQLHWPIPLVPRPPSLLPMPLPLPRTPFDPLLSQSCATIHRDVLRASTHTRLTLPCSLPLMPALWYLHFGIDL